MNDDHAPQTWLLASGYVDGDLGVAERSRAEADPEVMAAVDELRTLRAELGTAPPVSPVRRDSAIAAALAEYDRLAADRDVRPIAAGRRSHTRHPKSNRWLGAVAAAVVVVAGLGVVASSGLGGGDDDDAGVDQAAPAPDNGQLDALADDSDAPIARSAEPPASATAELAADSASAEASDAGAGAAEAMLTEDPAASLTGAPAAPDATTIAASANAYVFDKDQAIADVEQLGLAATQLLDQERSGQLPNTPETRCGTDEAAPLKVLAEGIYRTADAVGREVFVAVDEAARLAVAVDRATCSTVAQAPLP